jgi:glycosyltransferase involved in cell wall biosynthesis
MRITFLLPGYTHAPSGGFLVVYRMASELAIRGHTVQVLHPIRSRFRESLGLRIEARRAVRRRSNAVRQLGPAPWAEVHRDVQMRFVPSLEARWLPRGDALVATAWTTAYPAAEAPSRCGVAHYFIQSDESRWDVSPELALKSWDLPIRKAVIAGWLLDMASRAGHEATYVPLAIDRDTFNLVRPIEGRAPHVAFLGSNNAIKRTPLAIDLVSSVREEVPDLRASLFGSVAPDLRVPPWIQRIGVATQAALGELFNTTSAYLCTSEIEGWHLPPAEAMACGNAFVSTDIGGVRDYSRHLETAWLAPVDDPDMLREGLVKVLTDDVLRCGLASNGAREIGRFSWGRTIQAFEDWLDAGIR